MQNEAGLWTDGRYFLQAEEELEGSGITLYRKGEENVPELEDYLCENLSDTKTGEYNDLGVFYTDAEGQIHLERQETGWYKIKELEPAPGCLMV